jgi:hypothetical protein
MQLQLGKMDGAPEENAGFEPIDTARRQMPLLLIGPNDW